MNEDLISFMSADAEKYRRFATLHEKAAALLRRMAAALDAGDTAAWAECVTSISDLAMVQTSGDGVTTGTVTA